MFSLGAGFEKIDETKNYDEIRILLRIYLPKESIIWKGFSAANPLQAIFFREITGELKILTKAVPCNDICNGKNGKSQMSNNEELLNQLWHLQKMDCSMIIDWCYKTSMTWKDAYDAFVSEKMRA